MDSDRPAATANRPIATTLGRALDAAGIVMRNGGTTPIAERAFRRVLKASGREGAAAVFRLDSLIASAEEGGESVTVLHVVGPIGVNLARISELNLVTARLVRGEIPAGALESEFSRVASLPSPYSARTGVIAAACASSAFSQIMGGDQGSFGLALVAGAVGQTLRSILLGRGVAPAPTTLLCALISASIGALGIRLGWTSVLPATLVSAVVYMLPGLPLINGFIDLITQRHLLSGLERMANAFYLMILLAIGIAAAGATILGW